MRKNAKKFVGIMLFLTMLMGISSLSMAASFSDVPADAWYYDMVNWAADNGYMTGYDDGRFGASDNLERGQFATILYRMAGSPEEEFKADLYTDVAEYDAETNSPFYSIPAMWANAAGVITGYDDGRFGPSDPVTREQVATILYRYAKEQLGVDTSAAKGDIDAYPDGGKVSGFAREGIEFAIGAGLIRHDGGYINPQKYASRAQIATILQRFISYTEREEASNIANTDSKYTIEADVSLSGTGTGYHAKLVACTSTSAVSFGLQYDEWGVAPYTDKTTFLVENVSHNGQNGQTYSRMGYGLRNKTYHLMLTVQEDGWCSFYVNGVCVGSELNAELANRTIYLRVEGSGRKNGDSVHAEFTNIALKCDGVYEPDKRWGTHNFDSNPGVHSDDSRYASQKTVVIDGSIERLTPEQDWDNAYGIVSGTIQFVGGY